MAKKKRVITLIVTDEKKPSVPVKQGMRLEVIAVKLQDPAGKRKTILMLMLAGATSFVVATWMLPWTGAPPMSLEALAKSVRRSSQDGGDLFQ